MTFAELQDFESLMESVLNKVSGRHFAHPKDMFTKASQKNLTQEYIWSQIDHKERQLKWKESPII